MVKEHFDLEEERLLEERDIEFSHGIKNGPALRAYNQYIAEKKKRKEEAVI